MTVALPAGEDPKKSAQRVVQLVNDPLLEGDDRVVRDCDVLRTYLGAALGDVAVPDAMIVGKIRGAILGIKWMHLEGGAVHEESWAGELGVQTMIAQDVTHVLA